MEAHATHRGPSAGRRCRARPREPGGLRPTDVVGTFFVAGLAFMLAGAAVGLAGALTSWPDARWIALHLVFVGGISQLVLGASQFFAGAFLATDPPPRRLVRAQFAVWNAGAVGLAFAVPTRTDGLVVAASLALLVALALYGGGLAKMRSAALGSAPWATRWYAAAAAFFGVGIAAGAMLALAVGWRHGNLLSAHMALNLAGWFGAAIVGTLHTFLPSLARTTLRFPRLQAPAFACWAGGVTALAAGYGFGVAGLATAGWLALSAASLFLAANVIGCLAASPGQLSLPAWVVATAQAFLVAGVALVAATAVADGADLALVGSTRAAAAVLLVGGWIGLTVLGSLVHLLAVVVRVRDLRRPMPVPSPRWGAPVAALAFAGVGGLGLAQLLDLDPVAPLAGIAMVACYALLGAWILGLGYEVVTRVRPRL